MRILQQRLAPTGECAWTAGTLGDASAHLVLALGSPGAPDLSAAMARLRTSHPAASIIFATGSGEITNAGATTGQLAVTAVAFDSARVRCAALPVADARAGRITAGALAQQIIDNDLVHVLALFDSGGVDGAELARGFGEHLPGRVTLSGVPAGGQQAHQPGLIGLNEAPMPGQVVAIAFYGERLHVGYGSAAGWSTRGGERIVTSARGNLVLTLDGEPALDVYRGYLHGETTDPSGAMQPAAFMAAAREPGSSELRRVVAVDASRRALAFSGTIRTGSRVQFTGVAYEDLLVSAAHAAQSARLTPAAELALCVSGAGRQAILAERLADESRWMRRLLGESTCVTGLYARAGGGFATTAGQADDQSITVTTLRESRTGRH